MYANGIAFIILQHVFQNTKKKQTNKQTKKKQKKNKKQKTGHALTVIHLHE